MPNMLEAVCMLIALWSELGNTNKNRALQKLGSFVRHRNR